MNKLLSLYKFLSPKFQTIFLEYKVNSIPRFIKNPTAKDSRPQPFSALYEIINGYRDNYKDLLTFFLTQKDNIQLFKQSTLETNEDMPVWNSGYLPGLDVIGIYGMVAKFKPKQIIEIGSGNSTKTARKSIEDNQLSTKIMSVDPMPRANIDRLADEIVRKPLENWDEIPSIIERLQENDILFIDNSHRVFPNSDAMVCFLELLPFLRKGVIVHFHDIYLPYDYPQFMCDRFYNEQYMLAAFLLSNSQRYRPILPNFFISEDKELSEIIEPIWEHPNLQNVERHGGSFWIQIQ